MLCRRPKNPNQSAREPQGSTGRMSRRQTDILIQQRYNAMYKDVFICFAGEVQTLYNICHLLSLLKDQVQEKGQKVAPGSGLDDVLEAL